MQIFCRARLAISILLLVSFVGCVRGQKQNAPDGPDAQVNSGSSFTRDRAISGSSRRGRLSHWETPIERIYTFTACLKDRATESKLQGQPLNVLDEQGDIKSQANSRTDNSGCLQWNEVLGYNYFANSKYIEIRRIIRGAGQINRGDLRVALCINPWAEHGDQKNLEVIDCDYSKTPPGFAVDRSHSLEAFGGWRADKKNLADVQLFVDEVRLASDSSTLSAGAGKYSYTLTFKPKFVTREPNGDRTFVTIPKGAFRIYPYIRTVDKVNGVESARVPKGPETVLEPKDYYGGEFIQKFEISPQSLCQIGEIQLGLRVVPVNAPPGQLQPFDGVFRVGDCSQWMFNSRQISLLEDVRNKLGEAFKDLDFMRTGRLPHYTEFLNDWVEKAEADAKLAAPNPNDSAMDGQAVNEQFNFDPLIVKFDSIISGETSTKRSIAFTATTCVKNGLNRSQRLVNFHFDIYRILIDDKTGKETGREKLNDLYNGGGPYATDVDGCMSWKDVRVHQYYEREHYFKHIYEFRHRRSNPIDMNAPAKRRTAVINPWDYGFTFGRDVITAGGDWAVEAQDALVDKKPPSKLVVYGFRYETISFRYELDKFMNLKVRKNILLRLEPHVLRMHSITNGRQQSHESLRNGLYLLKTAIQKYYDDHGTVRQYLDTHQKIVGLKAGVIVTPTLFAVNDLRLMRVRSNMLIELHPVDERALCEYSVDHDDRNPERETWTPEERRKKIEAVCSFIDVTAPMVFPSEKDLDKYALSATGPEGTGLEPRTFVGPIIPLSNSFGSSMWPTDDLDNSDCETAAECQAIKSEAEQWAKVKWSPPDPDDDAHVIRQHQYSLYQKYFESASSRPLKNVSVTQLIRDQVRLDRMNQEDVSFNASFPRFSENSNLEYLQLGPEDPLRYQEKLRLRFTDRTIERVNKALPHEDMANNFLKQLNQFVIQDGSWHDDYYVGKSEDEILKAAIVAKRAGYHRIMDERVSPTSMKDLWDFLETGKMTDPLALRLCAFWFRDFLPKRLGVTEKELYRSPAAFQKLNAACGYALHRGPEEGQNGIFAADQRLKISDVDNYSFERGMSFNIQISGDKRMNHTEDFKRSVQINMRIPKMPAALGLPAANLVYDTVSDFLGFLSGNLGINRGQTNSMAMGRSSSAGTNLVIQMAKFNVTIKEYEKCATVGLRPDFVDSKAELLDAIHPTRVSYGDAMDLATRGMLICSGLDEHEPRVVRENYYYVSQNFVEGDMNDPGNLKTHPWLLTIRGSFDFAKFMRVVVDSIDLSHRVASIRERYEDARVQENQRLGMTRDHHRSEPSGVYFEGMAKSRGEAELDPWAPVAESPAGKTNQQFAAGDLPFQRDEKTRQIQLEQQFRSERDKLDQAYKEGRFPELDAMKLGRSPGENAQEVAARMAAPYRFSAQNELNFQSSEEKKRWRLWDVSHFQGTRNPFKLFFEDPHIQGIDDTWDYSLKKMAQIYSGTAMTMPGFIVITRESFDTMPAQ